MTTLELNQPVPPITLKTSEGDKTFSDWSGKNILLYFYPKDDTPGCTIEAQDFRDHADEFEQMNTVILGVSRDSLASHEKFICKYALPFVLISDPDETLCTHFDVMKEKSLYGKKYWGIERSTFFIDQDGVLKHAWRNVKVKDHAKTVLAWLRSRG